MAGTEPNAENKLFVGGCPPGSGEDDLRKIFEEHGEVQEVFIMRGGSRSGMACAFVRYGTQEMAQKAIETVHGQITLPSAAEPLVVRWADAPGSRKRDTREGKKNRGSGGGRGDGSGVATGRPVYGQNMDFSQQHNFMSYSQGYMFPQSMNGGFNQGYYGQGQMGVYYGSGFSAPSAQMQMMQMPYAQAMSPGGMMMSPHMMANAGWAA